MCMQSGSLPYSSPLRLSPPSLLRTLSAVWAACTNCQAYARQGFSLASKAAAHFFLFGLAGWLAGWLVSGAGFSGRAATPRLPALLLGCLQCLLQDLGFCVVQGQGDNARSWAISPVDSSRTQTGRGPGQAKLGSCLGVGPAGLTGLVLRLGSCFFSAFVVGCVVCNDTLVRRVLWAKQIKSIDGDSKITRWRWRGRNFFQVPARRCFAREDPKGGWDGIDSVVRILTDLAD